MRTISSTEPGTDLETQRLINKESGLGNGQLCWGRGAECFSEDFFSPRLAVILRGNPTAVVFLNVIFRAGEMVQQLIALVVLSEDMDSVFMGPSIGITHSHQ